MLLKNKNKNMEKWFIQKRRVLALVQAMQFWRKAERVVQYKQQVVSNARKKEVMDKHLDFLVGQTQRYSTLLAQRLAGMGYRSTLLSWVLYTAHVLLPAHVQHVVVDCHCLDSSSWLSACGLLAEIPLLYGRRTVHHVYAWLSAGTA